MLIYEIVVEKEVDLSLQLLKSNDDLLEFWSFMTHLIFKGVEAFGGFAPTLKGGSKIPNVQQALDKLKARIKISPTTLPARKDDLQKNGFLYVFVDAP